MPERSVPTVLLVDDEPDIRTVARLTLQQRGEFRVVEASSGAAALEMAARLQPDVVLLDVMMPGMDGPQVLSGLRVDPATAAIPVIFLTAKAMPAELERLRSLGALTILTKPFDPAHLGAQIRRALDGATGAGDSGPAAPAIEAGGPHGSGIAAEVAALRKLEGLTGETGRDLVEELIELFDTNTTTVVDRLRRLAGAPVTSNEVERLAHALKSSASTLGAALIAELARTIEDLAREGRAADTGPLVERIADNLAPTLGRLHAARIGLARDPRG